MIRILVVIVAVVNVAWGLFALARPAAAGRFVGLSSLGPHGAGELRAVYGALVIAIGVLIGLSLRIDGGEHWLRAFAILFAALACGRLVSLAADGASGYTLAALALEGGMAALLVWASRAIGP